MGICITRRIVASAALASLLLAGGCGVQEDETLRQVNVGQGILPGVVGTQGGVLPGTGTQDQAPATMESEAPLGLDTTYAPELYTPEENVEESRAASTVLVVPSTGFAIIDLTMMPNGVPADWNLTRAKFTEGDQIDLWIQYETYSAMSLDRHWLSAPIKLNYNEPAKPHAKGVYKVKLDWTVPYGSAQNNATFQFDLAGLGTKKYSAPFPYDIVAPAQPIIVTPPTGDGDDSVPGYGKGWTTMCCEDLLRDSDFDYNDFVARMQGKEYRNAAGDLLRIELTIKAIARGAGYDADWQLNFNGAFPNSSATATVNQYYANGTPHGAQRIWASTNGVSLPVFGPLRNALPEPPTSFATNTVAGTKYMDGDYTNIVITFSKPVKSGTYATFPYSPVLMVEPSGGRVYSIQWWTKPGDQVDSSGNPLAFYVPDTFAWPMEYEPIWDVYPSFKAWRTWINTPNAGKPGGALEPTPKWYNAAPKGDYFKRSIFK
jgi:LruC domain-containing protein